MRNSSILRKTIHYLLKMLNVNSGTVIKATANAGNPTISIYEININTITGEPLRLSTFRGKAMLLVNTASACGYTGQYADLRKLQEMYNEKLIVIGFPSNDFGKQEPGTHEEIRNFCTENFNITFPLTEKIHVAGENRHPVYQWLTTSELNGWNNHQPGWNFCKYLIDGQGRLKGFYSEKVNPLDSTILNDLE